MRGKEVPGKKVVVLDGDGHFTGIAMAEMLADLGKEVTFVTNMHDIAQFSLYTMELANNKRLLNSKKIKHITNHWGHSYENGKLSLFYLYRDTAELVEDEQGHWGRQFNQDLKVLECDSLVLVTMRIPNNALFAELMVRRAEWAQNDIVDVYRIGDCHAPRQLLNAIFDGHRLAREFDSPHPQRPLPFIRERQIWGAETYPKLGDARPIVEII